MQNYLNECLTNARLRGVGEHPLGPVEGVYALVAVDAPGVVLALLADAAALVVEVDVEGEGGGVDLLVVLALVRVAVAVARLALERVVLRVLEVHTLILRRFILLSSKRFTQPREHLVVRSLTSDMEITQESVRN